MAKQFNYNDTFVSLSGNEATIYGATKSMNEEERISYMYTKTGTRGEMTRSEFLQYFKPKGYKKNVNSDILKLIEAGYEFSSFWGDTVDGRSINVDLNEEGN